MQLSQMLMYHGIFKEGLLQRMPKYYLPDVLKKKKRILLRTALKNLILEIYTQSQYHLNHVHVLMYSKYYACSVHVTQPPSVVAKSSLSGHLKQKQEMDLFLQGAQRFTRTSAETHVGVGVG